MNQGEAKKKRNSSIELLRILCMLGIMGGHYFSHGDISTITCSRIINFTKSTYFLQCFSAFSKVTCLIFALISGYFSTSVKEVGWKKFFRLLGQKFFYAITITFVLSRLGYNNCGYRNIIKVLQGHWFVNYYLLLILCVPFLNAMCENLTKTMHKKLVALLLVFWSILPTIADFVSIFWGLSIRFHSFGNMAIFLVMYIVGSYLHNHVNLTKTAVWKLVLYCICSVAALLGSIALMDYLASTTKITNIANHASFLKAEYSIVAVAVAVSGLCLFLKFRFYSRIINRIASTVLGVYLIHDNDYLRNVIWLKIFPNKEYMYHPYLHAPIKILAVFACCCIIDLVRQFAVWLIRLGVAKYKQRLKMKGAEA